MSKKDNKKEKHEVPVQDQPETELAQEQVVQNETDSEQVQSEQAQSEQTEQAKTKPEEPSAKDQLAQQEDKFLRLAAEYDNYRKRTAKEKEALWAEAKADTAIAFLPVYDNLERALKQPTADEAYKKGVEMTMNQLKEVFSKLGITEIPALGQPFDPNFHNAVMHVEDESLGENVVAEVFQSGFQLGDKVIRFAMVKVAN